ncbi:MAG: GNAT family N-acetyltransferase [Thermoanaerobaculia bacterium]
MIVDLARPEDDPEIRRLLRDNPIDGAIRVSLEREPNAFLAAAVEGEPHHTVVAREPSGRIVGMGRRAVWNAFVNGEPRRLGYLSQLRVDRNFRGRRRLLAAGYAALRELRGPDETPFDLTSIIADNETARRLLGGGVPGLPTYRELSAFVTLVLPAVRPSRKRGRVEIEPGRPGQMDEIAECLARNRRRYQVAPFFTAAELASPERSRGLAPHDFRLALRDGRVVGCLALWDQQGFKQVVVRGYAPRLARWRPWINRLPRALGIPRLPDPGEALPHATISHVAVDGDDPLLFQALVESAHAEACRRGHAYAVIGLAAGHPWLPWLERRFRPRRYESVLYTVDWGDGAGALDGRRPHVEAALL